MMLLLCLSLLFSYSSLAIWLQNLQPLTTPPTTPDKAAAVMTPLSPAPNTGLELCVCLGNFLTSKGIDLTGTKAALMELKLTPDIISKVPVARLCKAMDAVEGHIWKFQIFCKEWSMCLEDKKRRVN